MTIISSLAAEPAAVVAKPTFPRPRKVVLAEPEPELEEPVQSFVEEEEEMIAPEPPELERPLQTIEAVLPETDLILPNETLIEEIEPEPEPMVEERPVMAQPPVEIIEPEPAQPRVILPKKKPAALPKEMKPVEKIPQAKQEVMQFESVTRGRFEKSEPTIVEGQDLDVPTFLRKNVRVK